MKLFIKYADNWADEMDLFGFAIADSSKWDGFSERVRSFLSKRGTWEWGIGSNQDVEFESHSDWLNCFTFTPLTDAEFDVMMEVFKRVEIGSSNSQTFDVIEGFFPAADAFDDFDEYEEDEDEDLEEDDEDLDDEDEDLDDED